MKTPQALAAIYPSYLLHWHFYASVRNDQSDISRMQKVKDAVTLFFNSKVSWLLAMSEGWTLKYKGLVQLNQFKVPVCEIYLPPFSLLLS